MIELDGSMGEGGGQILRSALGLSLVTGEPFRIHGIRAKRPKPGLMRQHLVAVEAAAAVGRAAVTGAAPGSTALEFRPGRPEAGEYRFAVGSAGSATLVFQTVLPALMTVSGPSRLVLEGGTHNPWAPPYDFLERAFLPLLSRMAVGITSRLERRGFFPAGGGRFEVEIRPAAALVPLVLDERRALKRVRGEAILSGLPGEIGQRELDVLRRKLDLRGEDLVLVKEPDPRGPGNLVLVEVVSEALTEVFSEVGEKGVKAESVAGKAAGQARAYLESGVPVGEHLADQLMLPMALAGAGSFTTGPLSGHATTNLEVIRRFLGERIAVERVGERRRLVFRG